MIRQTLLSLFVLASNGQLDYGDLYGDYGDYGGYGGYGDYGYGGHGGGGGVPAVNKDPNLGGFVQVDDLTFDKIVMGPYHAFVVAYNSENPEWLQIVDELYEVGKEFGRHLNLVLAKVNTADSVITADQYQLGSGEVKFFYVQEGSLKVEKLDIQPKSAEIIKYIKSRAGESYTVKALMPIVEQFVKSSEGREALVVEAEAIVPTLKPSEARVAKWYVKTMSSMQKKGENYLEKEYERLNRMLQNQADSLKAEKLTEFHDRLGVLQVFANGQLNIQAKDEL